MPRATAAASKQLQHEQAAEMAPPVKPAPLRPPVPPFPRKSVARSLSPWWKLVLLPILSIFINGVLSELASPLFDPLYSTTASDPNQVKTASLVLLKVLELGIPWILDFDASDIAALILQTRTPYQLWLFLAYNIQPLGLVLIVGLDALAAFAAYAILGRVRTSNKHALLARRPEFQALYDWNSLAIIAFFAASLYSLPLYVWASLNTPWRLSGFGVNHFHGLPTVEKIYDINLPPYVAIFLPLGISALELLFSRQAFGVKRDGLVESSRAFDKLAWLTIRQQELYKRVALVAIATASVTGIQTWAALKGSTVPGATIWGGFWGGVVTFVGLALIWVGNPVDQEAGSRRGSLPNLPDEEEVPLL